MGTREVVDHHLEALQAGDVEATLTDYTDESVLITTGTVARGRDQLRALFAPACETMFKPGAHEFTLESFDVDGDYALITWSLRFDGGAVPFGTDTFYVRNGKIAVQTGAVYTGGS